MKNIKLYLLIFVTIYSCNSPQKEDISFFYSFDGTKITYSDRGEGIPVLLIHGFINDGSSWNKTALKKELLSKGFRVIIPDLRGNGRSGKPHEPEAYQNNAEIKDLIALSNHLRLEKYVAVGYSRGSIILAQLLINDNRIYSAVLGGMGLDFTNPKWQKRMAFADAFSGRTELTDLTEGAVTYAKSIGADLNILGHLQDYQPVTSIKELQSLHIKILVIAGDQDLDNGSPEELQQTLPNSELVLVEGDHNNTYKQENFSNAVVQFLLATSSK